MNYWSVKKNPTLLTMLSRKWLKNISRICTIVWIHALTLVLCRPTPHPVFAVKQQWHQPPPKMLAHEQCTYFVLWLLQVVTLIFLIKTIFISNCKTISVPSYMGKLVKSCYSGWYTFPRCLLVLNRKYEPTEGPLRLWETIFSWTHLRKFLYNVQMGRLWLRR